MGLGAGQAYVEEALPVPYRETDRTSVTSARAFAELYKSYIPYVHKSARRLGVPREEADDVVQETFLTLHRMQDRVLEGPLHGLLFSILLRVVQRHRRSRRRRLAMTDEVALLQKTVDPVDPGPDKTVETAESLRLLEEVMDGLDPHQRAVLVLAELEERSLPEIADILSINVNTAASRLRRAREHVEMGLARRASRDSRRLK